MNRRNQWIAGLLAAGGFALWKAFRRRWWVRVHYQTLLGRTYSSDEVKFHLRNVLAEFDRVARPAGLCYWMDAGTLLGAHRHQGFIPWDDDLDLCIFNRDHETLLELADQFRPPYRLVEISRVWSVDKVIPGLQHLWPCKTFLRLLDTNTQLYTDIFEMEELPGEELQMLPLSLMHPSVDHRGEPFKLPRSVVLPTTELKFEDLLLPAPADVLGYLHRQIGPNLEPDHRWDELSQTYVAVEGLMK